MGSEKPHSVVTLQDQRLGAPCEKSFLYPNVGMGMGAIAPTDMSLG